MGRGECTLKLFCMVGEGLPCFDCCSIYCVADPPPREASATAIASAIALTPFKVLWGLVCI